MADNSLSCAHYSTLTRRYAGRQDMMWCLTCNATKIGAEPWTASNTSILTEMLNQPFAAKKLEHMDAQLLDLRHRVTDCETHIKSHGDENGSYSQQLSRMAERIGDLQKFAENLEANDRRRAVAVRQIQDYLQTHDVAPSAEPIEDAPKHENKMVPTLYVVVEVSKPKVEEYYAVFHTRDEAESYIEDLSLSNETYKLAIIEVKPHD